MYMLLELVVVVVVCSVLLVLAAVLRQLVAVVAAGAGHVEAVAVTEAADLGVEMLWELLTRYYCL